MNQWKPTSWTEKDALQQPTYLDETEFAKAYQQLTALPPLVTSWETERLKSQLAEAATGHRFLLQGGACAESFECCNSENITNRLKILLQMSLILTFGLKRQIIRVGRFAGQYAKPRTDDTETIDGITLPSYRGDIINRSDFTAENRRHDPSLMLRAYERAGLTLNFIRALVDGGFADLHHPEYWDLDFVHHSPRAREYQEMVESVSNSLRFMETLAGIQVGQINRVDFFTSHEGLHLLFEQAQTRQVPHREGWYNLTTHFPWIGMRTADPKGAHVEYYRGIRNPIAIKIGPAMTPEWLERLLDTLHPDNEPGRLTLIHRFGHKNVDNCLPKMIETVRRSGKTVLWCCDPMHGNTETTTAGVKTRRFNNILSELEQSFEIHASMGSFQGGVHFELTGDNVTECTGGARGLAECDLGRRYQSRVDPRLNYEQSLEMTLRISKIIQNMNGKATPPL